MSTARILFFLLCCLSLARPGSAQNARNLPVGIYWLKAMTAAKTTAALPASKPSVAAR